MNRQTKESLGGNIVIVKSKGKVLDAKVSSRHRLCPSIAQVKVRWRLSVKDRIMNN